MTMCVLAQPLHAALETGADVFARLRTEWRTALAEAVCGSVFLDVDYLELLWRHFATRHDEPWIVTVRQGEGGRLVGVLPLVRHTERVGPLPLRVLRHLGMWEGDRPGVLACVPADEVWAAAWALLRRRRADWERLDLRELDEGSWPLRHAARLGWALGATVVPDTQAGYQRIDGAWDDYLAARSRNTRQAFRRRQRLLEQQHPDAVIEVIDDPARIAAAYERYTAIERRGWKAGAEIGIWSDARFHAFYRELLPLLAARGQASIWLLRGAAGDMAGLVRYRWREVVYERHAAFDPAFASLSPSTLLCMEAVRRLHGSGVHESDVLGMNEPLAERPAISAWYDGVRQTHRLVVRNTASRLLVAKLLARAWPLLRSRPLRLGLAGVGLALSVFGCTALEMFGPELASTP